MIKTFKFQLPTPKFSIGVELLNDAVVNIPYIVTVRKGSCAFQNLPPGFRSNVWIVNINGESPITAKFALDLLKDIQKSRARQLTIDLVIRITDDKRTNVASNRAMFDQMDKLSLVNRSKPVLNSNTAIEEMLSAHEHLVVSPVKLPKPKSIFECLKGPFWRQWKAACYIQFEKNKKVAVFSMPVPRSSLPEGTRVFPTLLVPEYKPTDIPTIWECKVRDCTVGTNQVKGVDFPESYCPVGSPTTLKVVLVITAVLRNILAICDVKNAFQTSIAPREYRIWVSVPVLYLQWLEETESVTFERDKEYSRQCFNGNQGTKPASKIWYDILSKVLKDYGFQPCSVDQALFVKQLDNDKWFYCVLSTDDVLCSFPTNDDFYDLMTYFRKFFQLSLQEGSVLSYLNMRIIQSEHAISLDQAEYIFDLLLAFFGDKADRIKTASTPLRSDSTFEKDLYEATPLSETELVEYARCYRGGYRHHLGKLQHAANQTRFDIILSTQRLAEFSVQPTAIAFDCIARHYRYLAYDPLRPIMYPKGKSLSGQSTISFHVTPTETMSLAVPNHVTLFTDSEFARSLHDCRTWYCTVITLCNVIIQMKVKKTIAVMSNTTDSELHSSYNGVRRLKPLRQMLSFMGQPAPDPSSAFIDNKSVTDVIDSYKLTPRCRHLDVPIAYLHYEKDKSFHPILIKTQQMLADFGTKPLVTAIHKRLKYWSMGAQYLPKCGTSHYDDLNMKYYEKSYLDILRDMDVE